MGGHLGTPAGCNAARCSSRATCASIHSRHCRGLTRQSIDLRKKLFAKKMDARVKPAHDA
jgi:hypothetical protein